MIELKSCPCCGGRVVCGGHATLSPNVYFVSICCQECGCGNTGYSNIPDEPREEQIERWNRRVTCDE